MKKLVVLVLTFLIAMPAMAAPTQAQRAAFDAFYRQRFPDAPAATPAFSVARDGRLAATVDAPAKRGLRTLCRMQRRDFRLAGRWSADDNARSYAWLEQTGCVHRELAVELLQPMPDADLIALLERQAALLHSARILLGGNTSCASQRSFRFALAQITVGSAGPNPEVMAGLVFRSDHDTSATVWVRRSALEYNAWNVSCPLVLP